MSACKDVHELGWRSSTAEQLICNQQVVGSSPIASSSKTAVMFREPQTGWQGVWFIVRFEAVGVGEKEERFPSGQREQTVNLPAMPSKVRILPSPP